MATTMATKIVTTGALVRIHYKWRFGGQVGRILDSVHHGGERWCLVGFDDLLEPRTHWFHAMQFDLLASSANESSESSESCESSEVVA